MRSWDVVFLEEKTIENWKQQKSELTSQSTPTTTDLRPSELTQPIGRVDYESVGLEQPTNTDESESPYLLKSIEEYELESANPERPINTYEP